MLLSFNRESDEGDEEEDDTDDLESEFDIGSVFSA